MHSTTMHYQKYHRNYKPPRQLGINNKIMKTNSKKESVNRDMWGLFTSDEKIVDYSIFRYTGKREDIHPDFTEQLDLELKDIPNNVSLSDFDFSIDDEESYKHGIGQYERESFDTLYDDPFAKLLTIVLKEKALDKIKVCQASPDKEVLIRYVENEEYASDCGEGVESVSDLETDEEKVQHRAKLVEVIKKAPEGAINNITKALIDEEPHHSLLMIDDAVSVIEIAYNDVRVLLAYWPE